MVITHSEEHDKVTSPWFHLETGVTATQLKLLGLKPLQVSGPSTFMRPAQGNTYKYKVNTQYRRYCHLLQSRAPWWGKEKLLPLANQNIFPASPMGCQVTQHWPSVGTIIDERNLLPGWYTAYNTCPETVPSHTRKSRQIVHLHFEHRQILS